MAKSQLFTVIFTSVVILHRKKKISVKQLLTVTAICFALFVVMQLLRSNDVTDFSVLEFLAIYILSGTVAFDHFEPLDMGTGSNVFRFFIALLNRLGLSNISANATIPLLVRILLQMYIRCSFLILWIMVM